MKWRFWTGTRPAPLDDCETIDSLLSLHADGMASADEAQRVERHLPGCAACRESLVWIQATQRALAARPVVMPPADLRARIAGALAASSAVPVPAAFPAHSPRSFRLRPAYAAAASLAVFGIVSYGLLRPHPSANVNHMTRPPQIAALPPVTIQAPTIKPALPGSFVKPSIRHYTRGVVKTAPSDNVLTADNSTDEEPSSASLEIMPSTHVHTGTKAAPLMTLNKPRLTMLKKPTRPLPKMAQVAISKVPMETVELHKQPAVQPETKRPNTEVAAVPHPIPPAPAIIEKHPIVTPDLPVTVAAVASDSQFHNADLLEPVKARLGQMHSFTHATINRAASDAVLATRTVEPNGMAYIDGIHSP